MEPKDHELMPARYLGPDLAREIDALMAGPIPPRPAVIVVGDDDVAGFTPAPGLKPKPRA
jgi:hypothetical protein